MFDFQMMVDLYKPQTTAATASAILQRLMMKGYLWAFYIGGPDLGEFIGHAMVIYGVVDSTGKAPTLKIMDPWTGTLTFMSMEDLNKTATVFVCWYETGPNWSNDMFRIMSAVAKAT